VRQEYAQHDRAKPWRLQLSDEDGIPDLRGADVYFVQSNVVGTAGDVVRLLPELPPDPVDGEDAEHGWIEIVWQNTPPLDLAVIGVFRVEFRVLYNPGTPQERQETFPAGDMEEPISLIVRAPA
jgi:hypothetical protein